MSDDVLKSRIRRIGGGNTAGKCVLYVMSRDQRVQDNHALLAAQKHALTRQLPLAVVFCLMPKSGYRARGHYQYMLDGLAEVEAALQQLSIPFMMLIGNPAERLEGMFHHVQPDAVYFDFNPLRGPLVLHRTLAEHAIFPVYEVDTHNIVPVWLASDKQEVGARTIRPKIHRLLATFLAEPEQPIPHPYPWSGPVLPLTHDAITERIDEVLAHLVSNKQELPLKSGESAALRVLEDFINTRLKNYAEDRNDPSKGGLSGLSPYLHFGQLSSLRAALNVTKAARGPGVEALIEEMVVRKELSDNYCFYNSRYDNLDGAPNWAAATLKKHSTDERPFLYSREEFEAALTHDTAWNAAQIELLRTGKMHGYMRMYWAKKVLEWSASPEDALNTLIYLNDFYSIDGGDPNGYVGILWSVAGLHDRPWGERPVYGTVRSMVYGGLKRKFDISAYEKRWQ